MRICGGRSCDARDPSGELNEPPVSDLCIQPAGSTMHQRHSRSRLLRIPPAGHSTVSTPARFCGPRPSHRYVHNDVPGYPRYIYCPSCRPPPYGGPPTSSLHCSRYDRGAAKCSDCVVVVFVYTWRCWACDAGNDIFNDTCNSDYGLPPCGYRRDSACVVTRVAFREVVRGGELYDYDELWEEEV